MVGATQPIAQGSSAATPRRRSTLARTLAAALAGLILLAMAIPIAAGVITYLGFSEPAMLGAVVGVSIFFCMAMSATLGTTIPLILKRFDVDAAIATGPFVTTSIDILGVLMYFYVAKLLLKL